MLVEIAVQDLAGAATAAEAGADRLELCTGLSTGGLTPSAGLIASVVTVGLPVRVLIRCREGDFAYLDEEIGLMAEDIRRSRDLGASGVVVGAVHRLGDRPRLDRAALSRLVGAAEGLPTVLHRASDVVGPTDTAETLAETGIAEVLTSGGGSTVAEGMTGLGRLAGLLGGDRIIAGGGLAVADVAELAAFGVGAVHASASRSVTGGPTGPGAATGRSVTAAERVAALVAAVREVSA